MSNVVLLPLQLAISRKFQVPITRCICDMAKFNFPFFLPSVLIGVGGWENYPLSINVTYYIFMWTAPDRMHRLSRLTYSSTFQVEKNFGEHSILLYEMNWNVWTRLDVLTSRANKVLDYTRMAETRSIFNPFDLFLFVHQRMKVNWTRSVTSSQQNPTSCFVI